MSGIRRSGLKLQAAGALLAVLIGWLSAPIALTKALLDICSMPCCVSEGHCCCSPAHSHVLGESRDERDVVSGTEVSKYCPQGCTASNSTVKLDLRELAAAPVHRHISAGLHSCGWWQFPPNQEHVTPGPASPRSPPLLSHV
jgi:hypothetical protein